ncbi:proline dehydrogenase family protein [Lishizhenia sp.]|uniref:proline dehydrogenase family protein n=1 Tax=Lishizhenia sp. TaxID=2497594 RepID=UPI00299D15EA|nr:proline dehydrogenase family protein [Lishizhenia sp.]MDX1446423.1 proline dehydrogenase family protein [Lishizhenia sp.]
MVSFENTEIAFASKSNRDLNRAYRLFKLMGYPSLVNMGSGVLNMAMKMNLPVKGIVKRTIFRQFCGGETILECDSTIEELNKFNVGTILDYSVEGMLDKEDFTDTVNELISTIIRANGEKAIPYAVFKVTGLANFNLLKRVNDENAEISEADRKALDLVIERIDTICAKAHEFGVPVFIDAEESWIQDIIDRICAEMMRKYNREQSIVFNTVQMYRHDRLQFLKDSIKEAKEQGYNYGVKLVRGAYMEKERARAEEHGYPSPIQPDKAATDRDYDLALEHVVQHIDYCKLCAGTHNEESSAFLAELLEKYNLEKDDRRIYFAQLLGMSDHISYNLSYEGYNVAKYVPYGPVKEVIPYLMRRAEENTSVAGQTGRELSLIMKEKKRRRRSSKPTPRR